MSDAIAHHRVRVLVGGKPISDVHAHMLVFPTAPASSGINRAGKVAKCHVEVDGVEVVPWDCARDTRVFALHKPRGLEVTMERSNSHSTVRKHADFAGWLQELTAVGDSSGADEQAASSSERHSEEARSVRVDIDERSRLAKTTLFHVGRLDKPTSGLIFVTNDGDLSASLCLPGLVPKEYIATVRR